MAGLICAGDVYLDVLDENMNSTGFLPPVNATRFVLAPRGAESIERVSKMRNSYGQVLDAVSTPNPHETIIAFDDMAGEILAAAFSGHRSALNEAAGTDVAVEIVAVKGRWVSLGHRNLLTVSVVNGLSETVDPANYEVNMRLGLLRLLETSSLETGEELTVTLSKAAVTGERVSGATRSQIDVSMFLDGRNLATGDDIFVRVPRATLNADNEVDFLADEFVGVELTGITVVAEGETAPYYVERPVLASGE